MKSQFVNGTINKDIYIHTDAETIKRVDELEEEIVLKQDILTAGENITISEDNVISANVQPGAFEVVYGETPFEDIFNAYHSGSIPVCTVNTQTFYVSMMYGSSAQTGYAIFTNSQGSYTSNFDVVYPSTYSQIRTSYLESTANLVQTISSDSTTSQYPSAKAVWNQAAKYTKVKRFVGHIQDNEEGRPLILDSNNLADIYNAQTSGNQIVFIFDDTNKLTYRVNYCFIDNTYPETQKIVVYATAEHADTEQEPTFGVSERYFDTLYAKSAAGAQLLYPYTRQLQDKSLIVNYSIVSGEGTSEAPFILSHNSNFITILDAFNNGKQVIAKLDASPVTGIQNSYLIANLSQITPTSFDFVGMGYIGRFVSFIINYGIDDDAIGIIQ